MDLKTDRVLNEDDIRAYRILVVDDEPDICWAIENALGLHGYTVRTVNSAEEGLRVVSKGCYDLAFIDAKLPSMDGLELASHIRGSYSKTAVVLMSAYYYSQDSVISNRLENGTFVDFMAKPFDVKEILELTERALRDER